MILVFILFWFGALCGMEQEVLVGEERLPMLSLKEIAVRSVCSHLVGKKISVDQVRQKLPKDIVELIELDYKPQVLSHKYIEGYILHTITPDHRYMLVIGMQGLLRLDLYSNRAIVVVNDSKKKYFTGIALSASGNLVALLSLSARRLWVKDITQNKVIAEKDCLDVIKCNPMLERMTDIYYVIDISFVGEKKLLLNSKTVDVVVCLSIDKNLEQYSAFTIEPNLDAKEHCVEIGILPTSQEYIIYKYSSFKDGAFLRKTLDGEVKNSTIIKGLVNYLMKDPIIYEPDMLIAYKQGAKTSGQIDIVSLKEWPEIAVPLAQLRCTKEGKPLAFANKGKWLIVADSMMRKAGGYYCYRWTVWNWRDNQLLYTYRLKQSGYLTLSSTDEHTHHPCLFTEDGVLYSFDPIKAIAANMLSQTVEQQTAAISNDNNSKNNNNNVSNDNGPKPATSKKTSSKQDSEERRHKRPKK